LPDQYDLQKILPYKYRIPEKKMEKELYSKACVAESIRFVVDEAREESVNLKEYKKFSCNLATILKH